MDTAEVEKKLNSQLYESMDGIRKLFPEAIFLCHGYRDPINETDAALTILIDGEGYEYDHEVDEGGYPGPSERGWRRASPLKLLRDLPPEQIAEATLNMLNKDPAIAKAFFEYAYGASTMFDGCF